MRLIANINFALWIGINLPAHTVVVKGTDVYNPEKGGNVDLRSVTIVINLVVTTFLPISVPCATNNKFLSVYLMSCKYSGEQGDLSTILQVKQH